jgi:UDP-N-acetyl-D-glucosamine dehydrogenase
MFFRTCFARSIEAPNSTQTTMKIAIIGLGYVGLPLSLQFASSGVEVVGLDVDSKKVDALRERRSYIKHIADSSVSEAIESGRFSPSTDFARVEEVEAIIICVPTPLSKHREPDISYVLETGRRIAPFIGASRTVGEAVAVGHQSQHLGVAVADEMSQADAAPLHADGEAGSVTTIIRRSRSRGRLEGWPWPNVAGGKNGHNGASSRRPKLIVLESTTYPGTTDEDLRAILEEGSGLKAGTDFHLAFSPEREDPANPNSQVAKIPKVVGGFTPRCLERATELYSQAIDTLVPVSSCRAAEATKLLENIFRSVNIALVNELKVVYGAMGIDIWEVIDAAKTKPFGYMPFYPGPGLGGHCIPIDPFYLTWKAHEFGQHTRFIELAGEINAAMPSHVVGQIVETLNKKGLAIRGSRILLVGLAYKADVDDMRESPTFAVMDQLKGRGAELRYYDPFIPEVPPTKEHAEWTGARSIDWTREAIAGFDCVVICTAHSEVDYRQLAEWSNQIVDTRNAMARAGVIAEKVIKA